MGRVCGTNGEKRNADRILVGKSEGKSPLRRPMLVDDVKMDVMRDRMDWIDLAQDRDQLRALIKSVMNLRVPQNAGKFLNSCTIGGFSRRTQLHE
jgi:hypothetical protein